MLTSVTANTLIRGLLDGRKVIPYNKAIEERNKFRELVEKLSWENLTDDELGFINELTTAQKDKILLETNSVDLSNLLFVNSARGWSSDVIDYNCLRDNFDIVPEFTISDIPYFIRYYLNECIIVKLNKPVPLFSHHEILTQEDLIDLKTRMKSENFKIFMDELKSYLGQLNSVVAFLLNLYNLITDESITLNVLSKKFPELYKIYKKEHDGK